MSIICQQVHTLELFFTFYKSFLHFVLSIHQLNEKYGRDLISDMHEIRNTGITDNGVFGTRATLPQQTNIEKTSPFLSYGHVHIL